jgi:hypothetical protein
MQPESVVSPQTVGRTNEERRARRPARSRPVRVTPLMELGMWVHNHGQDIVGVPGDILRRAARHVRARIRAIDRVSDRVPMNARRRAKRRWLARWRDLIQLEVDLRAGRDCPAVARRPHPRGASARAATCATESALGGGPPSPAATACPDAYHLCPRSAARGYSVRDWHDGLVAQASTGAEARRIALARYPGCVLALTTVATTCEDVPASSRHDRVVVAILDRSTGPMAIVLGHVLSDSYGLGCVPFLREDWPGLLDLLPRDQRWSVAFN